MARSKIAITAFALSMGFAAPAAADGFLDDGPGLDTSGQFVLAAQAVGAAEGLRTFQAIDPFLQQRVENMRPRLERYDTPFYDHLRQEAHAGAIAGNWTEKQIEGYLDAAEMPFSEVLALVDAAKAEKVGPPDDALMWHIATETMNYAPTAPVIEGAATLARLELSLAHVLNVMSPGVDGGWINDGSDISNSPVIVAAAGIGLTRLAEPLATTEFTRAPADPLAGIAKDVPTEPFEAAAAKQRVRYEVPDAEEETGPSGP